MQNDRPVLLISECNWSESSFCISVVCQILSFDAYLQSQPEYVGTELPLAHSASGSFLPSTDCRIIRLTTFVTLKGIKGDYTFSPRQLYLPNVQWSMCSFRPFNIVINWKHRSFPVVLHASSVHCSTMLLKCDLEFVFQCPPSGPSCQIILHLQYVSNLSRQKIKARWRSVKTREECYTPGCLISTSVWMSLTWRETGKHTRPS